MCLSQYVYSSSKSTNCSEINFKVRNKQRRIEVQVTNEVIREKIIRLKEYLDDKGTNY